MVRPVHAVPVFEGRKMHGVARILTYACVMALPAVRRSLGRLNCDEAFLGAFFFFFFFLCESSSVQSSDERVEASQFLWRCLSARRARKLGMG